MKFRLSIYEPEHLLLREWLIKSRRAANLTQRGLAKNIGVTRSLVGKVEQGERRLDAVELIKYCRAMSASPCEVIGLIE